MRNLAPIVLFTYNRLFETQQTVDALQKNHLASESELHIFSDGPKNAVDGKKVGEVREYLYGISGFKKIRIKESDENMGLANSVINGVTEVLSISDKVIVLEDDLVTSPNFLDFMNEALEFYKESPEVISISGYSRDLATLNDYDKDYYVGFRASSWGWGTWNSKWQDIDWDVSDYSLFRNNYTQRLRFFNIGNDMPGMLKNHINGKIDSWAIRWCFHQFKNNLLTVFASKSKVNHLGITEDATHAVGAIKFNTPLDSSDKRVFEFHQKLVENKRITKEFRSMDSLKSRILSKLKKSLKGNNP